LELKTENYSFPSMPFSKLVNPRFPSAALGLESSNATVVHLERSRRSGFAVRRAATATLPEGLIRPSFDEQNISDANTLASLISEVTLSAGLAKQNKWSVALPEAATRVAILTMETAPASRAELDEVLRWKYERTFGATQEEIRVSRERLPSDAQGRQRYLVVGIRLAILAEYEDVFAALGWRTGLVLPRHQGEALWISNAPGDTLLISSHTEGFTALMLRGRQPTIVRSVMCEAEDRDDELYRILLFYRDRLTSTGNTNMLDRLLVVGEGFDKHHVSEIVNETLEITPRVLGSADVGLALPSGEFSFDAIAAPAGLATLAW
jgi:Tfp pilus assembly PilM family ATPase